MATSVTVGFYRELFKIIVHPDPVWGQIERHDFRQPLHRELGRAVDRAVDIAEMRERR